MELTYTDRIIISAALSSKADFINEELKKNPNDEFWTEKLEGVKARAQHDSLEPRRCPTIV